MKNKLLPNVPLVAFSVFVITALFVCGGGLTAHAQFTLPFNTTNLAVSPTYPTPGESYTVRINAPSLELSRSSIAWSVSGSNLPDAVNKSEIVLTAPELGVPTRIVATITAPNREVSRLETTMVPSHVDLVIEGKTLVPHFYAGRPLPSSGSEVRVVAIPHLFNASGVKLSPSDLSYRWSVNDKLVLGAKGANVLETELERLGDTFLSLTIENVDGSVSYKKNIVIPEAEPTVHFYEESPLYGLARTALGSRFVLDVDETTVKAEPYFVSSDIFSNAQHTWTLNRERIQNPSENEQYITLRRVGGGGSSEVGFSVRNLDSLLQYATGLFTVEFR